MERLQRPLDAVAARVGLGLLVVLVVSLTVVSAHAAIEYLYDDGGRLIAVIDPAQGAAIYSYDPVGNLLSIQRQGAGLVSILHFTPKTGPVGTIVTIQGTGFSMTPNQNAVAFNGVAATVTSATATELVAAVPSGATSGAIGVTAPAGAAISSTPFTVTATSAAPTITGFTPSIGAPGTAVTITGTNFDVPHPNNKVTFNVTRAYPTSGTATMIGTSVPSVAGSGHIGVATPLGAALSTADFFIPPTPYTAADVDFTGRVAVGGSIVVSIPAQNHIGLVVFDGVAGQRMGLETRASTIPNGDLRLYSPTGGLLQSRTVGTQDQVSDVGTLPTTGTYTVMVDPCCAYSGSLTLTPGLADLQIPAATAPTTAERSNTGTYQFPVSWTIQNFGTATAYPNFVVNSWNWHDRVYLSTNTTYDAGDVQVAAQQRGTSLGAGASYTVATTTMSPAMSPGTYYVLFVTDQLSLIPETTETNNLRVVGPITLLGAPDLVPTAFTGPTSVPRSNTGTYALPVSWTVTNEGQSATAMGAYDYVYLSADATWDAADTLLTSVYTAPPLAASASYIKNQTITTSAVAAGAYYLIVRADASGYVAESNETNNTHVLGPITFLAGPDLVPTALTGPASVPRSNTGTYALPVSWTVTNEGQSATAMGAYDYVYLSADATWDAADTLLTSVYTAPPLAAGASYTKNQTITTSAVAAGTYYLIVRTDASGYVAESNETNNTRVLGPLAFLAGPDLVPTAFTGPTTAVPRNANGTYTFAVSWTVENQGQSPTAVFSWTDRLYLSTNATWDGADSLILSVSRTTALAPASSYTENRPSVTTGVVTAGSYYLIVRTDADGVVAEADETNNTRVYGPFTLSP